MAAVTVGCHTNNPHGSVTVGCHTNLVSKTRLCVIKSCICLLKNTFISMTTDSDGSHVILVGIIDTFLPVFISVGLLVYLPVCHTL